MNVFALESVAFRFLDGVDALTSYGIAYMLFLELLSVLLPQSDWTDRRIRLLANELSYWMAFVMFQAAYLIGSIQVGALIYSAFTSDIDKLRLAWDASKRELCLSAFVAVNHAVFVYPQNSVRHDVIVELALYAFEKYVRVFFWTMLICAMLFPAAWYWLPRRAKPEEEDSLV